MTLNLFKFVYVGLLICLPCGCGGRADRANDDEERDVQRKAREKPLRDQALPQGVIRRLAECADGKSTSKFLFSADEQLLALASQEDVRVCNLRGNTRPHSVPVNGFVDFALSPDGKILVTSDRENGVVAWDACWETRLFSVRSPEPGKLNEMGSRVVFTHDSKILINRVHNQVRFYDLESRKEIVTRRFAPNVGEGGIGPFYMMPDGHYLLLLMSLDAGARSPSNNRCCAVDINSGKIAWQFDFPAKGLIEACHVSADGRLLLVVTHHRLDDIEMIKNPEEQLTNYCTYSLWELASGKRVLLKDRARHRYAGEILAADGRYFLLPGTDEKFASADVWDLQRNELMGQLKLPDNYDGWGYVKVLRDSKTVAVNWEDGKKTAIDLWDLSPALKPFQNSNSSPRNWNCIGPTSRRRTRSRHARRFTTLPHRRKPPWLS